MERESGEGRMARLREGSERERRRERRFLALSYLIPSEPVCHLHDESVKTISTLSTVCNGRASFFGAGTTLSRSKAERRPSCAFILLVTCLTLAWLLAWFYSMLLSLPKVPHLLHLGRRTQSRTQRHTETNKSTLPAETKLQF